MKLTRIRGSRREGIHPPPSVAVCRRTKSLRLAIGATVLVSIGVASCDSGEQSGFRPPTAPAPGDAIVRVELIAPGSIAPGESAQLTANAVKSDGSVENVSARAQWTSSDRSVLDISSTGLAAATARGEAFIRVSYQSRNASTNMFVLPAGTYRLDGTVTDSGFGLSGVSVSVTDGGGNQLTTTTNANGKYALYGVRDRVRLQAKGSGYFDEIREIDVADHRTFDFDMRIERPRTDLRGRYRLTIDRSTITGSSCTGAGLPESRSYDATVDQDGPRLVVTLSDADFIITRGRGNAFKGAIDGNDRVTFALGEEDEYYWEYRVQDLVERISATHTLVITGRVTAGLSPSGISGTLAGFFLRAEGTAGGPPFKYLPNSCYAAHRFEMVRR